MACLIVKSALISVISVIYIGFVCCIPNCQDPGQWCSSVETARDCKVLDRCVESVWHGPSPQTDDRVNFALYYESLCPDCKNFFKDQMYKTFQQLSSIMNLQLVPYGNAEETQVGGTWKFTCQHGAEECLGNLIQTCALHLYVDLNVTMPFIACMEFSNLKPEVTGPSCAKKFRLDYKSIDVCVRGSLGNTLEHNMAVLTDQLDPPHQYVPWVTLNGKHTEDIEQQAESNLIKLICDTYTGTKPPACSSLPERRCRKNSNPLKFSANFGQFDHL